MLDVALVLSGNEVAVAFLGADDLDPRITRYAFDEAHVAFANGWVALGSFAVCSGLGHRLDRIPPPLAGLVGDRGWGGAGAEPPRLDQRDLAVAPRDVLAVGHRRGDGAPSPQLPRCSAVRLNPMRIRLHLSRVAVSGWRHLRAASASMKLKTKMG